MPPYWCDLNFAKTLVDEFKIDWLSKGTKKETSFGRDKEEKKMKHEVPRHLEGY